MRGPESAIARGLRGLGAGRPPLRVGVLVAVISVAAATAAIYPLKAVAPAVSLSVVYLPVVVLVSVYWGVWLGAAGAGPRAPLRPPLLPPPLGRFPISDGRNWVALAAFTTIAAVVSTIADVARSRALVAELRRREAD